MKAIKAHVFTLQTLALFFLVLFTLSVKAQGTIVGINPSSTTIPQTLSLVVTGSGTNFTGATSFRLKYTGSGQFYDANAFTVLGPTSVIAEFSLPPNAPLGTYSLLSYLTPPLIGGLTVNPGPGSNDKQVWDTTGTNADGPVDPSTSMLDYLIRFQNTGNDTAFTVVVRDTMDTQLNLSTLTIIGNSHPVQYSVTGQNHVAFTFPNILLVDSNTNEPLSHGYIAYRIALDSGLTTPATIENAAGIYFDFNAVVATNTVSTTLCPQLNVSFSSTNTGLDFNFSGQADTSVTSWSWDFGDSTGSISQNPTHTYLVPGTYQVCLTVSNGCDSTTICDSLSVCPPLALNFGYSVSGLTANFFDLSSSSAISWDWGFGDGGSSTLQNPSHQYNTSGRYMAGFTVSNGCWTESRHQWVDICPPISAYFNYTIQPSFIVDFVNSSMWATDWYWDFGDGQTSTLQNPSHQFVSGRAYDVCLWVSNHCQHLQNGHPSRCSEINLVGVKDSKSWIENLSVSPNPSDGLFSIRGTVLPIKNLVFRVYDVRGKVVHQANVPVFGNTLNYELNLEEQAAGLYLVELSSGVKKARLKVQKQ